MEGLGITLPAFVAQLINFVLLLVILRAVAYKPIIKMLDERSARIRESMERAEEIKAQAERTEAEFAQRIAEARREGQEIISQAEKISERLRQEEIEKTRKLVDEQREKALEAIAREREAAILELRKQVANLAVLAAGRAVGSSLDSESHQRLIREALAEAEKLNVN